jgi:hypothetical protein
VQCNEGDNERDKGLSPIYRLVVHVMINDQCIVQCTMCTSAFTGMSGK